VCFMFLHSSETAVSKYAAKIAPSCPESRLNEQSDYFTEQSEW
jgi:hypothetical protein